MGTGSGEENVAVGGGAAIALTVCFWCIGVPAIFSGIIMMVLTQKGSILWTVGLILILLSLLVLIAGVLMIIALCTGCFGKYGGNRVDDNTRDIPVTSHHVTSNHPHLRTNVNFLQPPPPYSPRSYDGSISPISVVAPGYTRTITSSSTTGQPGRTGALWPHGLTSQGSHGRTETLHMATRGNMQTLPPVSNSPPPSYSEL